MKDVASRAGVALKTVSRVVNGEPGVTPETAKRVLGAIADLGFRRNESARLLRTGRTATLGFIADTWTDPDAAAVYRGLENVVREHGYLLYSGSTDADPDREERLSLAMCARRVDGLIIIPTPGSHDYLVSEIEAGVATVFVLRPPELVRADAVLPDERGGARAAIGHLVARGHRRIGFLGGPDGHRSRALRAGCAEALSLAGLPVDRALLNLSAANLAGAGVTAVFCADPERTHAALRAGVADRVAIVGFGNFELADLVTPPVSVVSYDPVLIGSTAGELLVRRLAGDQTPPRRVEVPVRLTVRLVVQSAGENLAEDHGKDRDDDHHRREQENPGAVGLHLPRGRKVIAAVLERLEARRFLANVTVGFWHADDPTPSCPGMRDNRIGVFDQPR
jgi:LacI family transcriptional regulator